MDRDLLAHLPILLSVARRGGFAAAAGELGLSPSAVSHAVRLVEDRLGQPIFARTTRSVALTETGERLLAGIGPALADLTACWEAARHRQGRISGLLRLNVPSLALPLGLTRVMAAMAERFPDVQVEAFINNGLTDIVAEGFDAGVRLGEMIDADMIALRLTPPFDAILVAAPAYIAQHGQPGTLADLAAHRCIGFRQIRAGGLYRWDLVAEGRDVSLAVPSTSIVNDPLAALDLARAGTGIAYLFEPLARADLAAGRLIHLLPESAVTEPGLFLYYPRRSRDAPKLRAFITTARDVLKG
ncbi:LysR family transcriptional regulator [Elstera cyanobacteriorum]|uniref:LysR family transcriptional regulator n=1 Tax=Elstera cyanobacteriorum TaxID=2022747 RepID=UPI002353E6F5|nr:LysR family transcriptional regulator [Elstera cyanobacteriorum]MCK6442979.1 LysR family transcriptional regulator [Elstera cyanobacteriorum]